MICRRRKESGRLGAIFAQELSSIKARIKLIVISITSEMAESRDSLNSLRRGHDLDVKY
jgi:hypothetical protein